MTTITTTTNTPRHHHKHRTSPCPACGGTAYLVLSRHHGFVWKCRCNAIFAHDEEGDLIPPTPCPSCKEHRLGRFESRMSPGRFFHYCGACEAFFHDSDGSPAALFDPE